MNHVLGGGGTREEFKGKDFGKESVPLKNTTYGSTSYIGKKQNPYKKRGVKERSKRL